MTREHPILFSGEMVRAILDDRKSQTRRLVKPTPILDDGSTAIRVLPAGRGGWAAQWAPETHLEFDARLSALRGFPCPYGQPGDRLWVRETWGVGTRPDPFEGWRDGIEYRADEIGLPEDEGLTLHRVEAPKDVSLGDLAGRGWRPSIHMPRWASRLTLAVESVRVERLLAITEEDAIAEGVADTRGAWEPMPGEPVAGDRGGPREAFRVLWDQINGKRAAWSSNPWVFVVGFRRVEAAVRAPLAESGAV